MVETARTLNPTIEIVVRSHNDDESAFLRREGFGRVFSGEEELARSMIAHIHQRCATRPRQGGAATVEPAVAAGAEGR
jgi:CPA2 family monovalent cation:H+ antiporter-2